MVEADEDILAAMGGVLEGVKPGRKSFCYRKGEGNFDANATATTSATRLLIFASCFFASCLSLASSGLAWLWFSNEISSDMTCMWSAIYRSFIGPSSNNNPAREYYWPTECT